MGVVARRLDTNRRRYNCHHNKIGGFVLMDTYEEKPADNLDDAWSNFDPNHPLKAGSPFFVQQFRPPLGSLKRALLQRLRAPQKRYIAGFKAQASLHRLTSSLRTRNLRPDISLSTSPSRIPAMSATSTMWTC